MHLYMFCVCHKTYDKQVYFKFYCQTPNKCKSNETHISKCILYGLTFRNLINNWFNNSWQNCCSITCGVKNFLPYSLTCVWTTLVEEREAFPAQLHVAGKCPFDVCIYIYWQQTRLHIPGKFPAMFHENIPRKFSNFPAYSYNEFQTNEFTVPVLGLFSV